jgi:hypothetical protein
MDPKPLCPVCSNWQPYACKVGRTQTEAWKCTKAVTGAPERKECRYFLREIGVEGW